MAGRQKGEVLERTWKSGRGYALRFWAYGGREYLTLGFERDGWTYGRAEEELENILADVRRGIWVPPKKKKRRAEGDSDEEAAKTIFGPFARQLVASRKGQVSDNHLAFLEWALRHLLPYFGDWALVDIDVQAVDAYRHHKVQEAEARLRAIERRRPLRDERGQILRPLSARSINHTIDTLQWVLSVALEYKLIVENAAAGKRRRLIEPHKPPVHLDTAEQIEAMLDAAEEMDRDLRFTLSERRVIVATFVLAGPRALEVGHMLWRDVDLANGRLYVGRSKTQAGLREIRMLPILRALAERDGQAPRKEIRVAVLKAVDGSLSEVDREALPSGKPRWEAGLDKARSKLVEAGCLKADSRRGYWELAGLGYDRLAGGRPKRRRVAAARRSGAGGEREPIAA